METWKTRPVNLISLNDACHPTLVTTVGSNICVSQEGDKSRKEEEINVKDGKLEQHSSKVLHTSKYCLALLMKITIFQVSFSFFRNLTVWWFDEEYREKWLRFTNLEENGTGNEEKRLRKAMKVEGGEKDQGFHLNTHLTFTLNFALFFHSLQIVISSLFLFFFPILTIIWIPYWIYENIFKNL